MGMVRLRSEKEGHVGEVLAVEQLLPVTGKRRCADVDPGGVFILWQCGGWRDARV